MVLISTFIKYKLQKYDLWLNDIIIEFNNFVLNFKHKIINKISVYLFFAFFFHVKHSKSFSWLQLFLHDLFSVSTGLYHSLITSRPKFLTNSLSFNTCWCWCSCIMCVQGINPFSFLQFKSCIMCYKKNILLFWPSPYLFVHIIFLTFDH